jgi:hypothetical protein
MNGSRFDTLTRSLTAPRTRRGLSRVLGGLAFGGPLALLGPAEAEAGRKKGKRRKKRKKKRDCAPNCAGKQCGDDGCGGSCGPCFRGSCQGGACVCASGEEVCNGACMTACGQGQLRDPDTCQCCTARGRPCGLGSQCCSGLCQSQGGFTQCVGRNGLEDCTWGEQCRTGVCDGGKCTCDGDICNGTCRIPCAAPRATRDWETCGCCVNNGHTCIDGTCTCCCSGTCSGPVGQKPCEGLASGANCSFDAQCASGKCEWTDAGGGIQVQKCVA